jgi:aspartyl-tRNA(Asn)/glutamyl-tRNA(Gln) amidotransferase subunit A
VRDGLEIASGRYLDERAQIDGLRETFFTHDTADVFLWPATPTTAPEGLGWTGDPKYIAPWTALGGPIVTLPAGKAANGLPLGVIIAARPGADAQMCDWARRLGQVIGT